MNILKLLDGKKTYLVAIAGAVVFIVSRLNLISPDLEAQIYKVLGITVVATARSAIKKVEE